MKRFLKLCAVSSLLVSFLLSGFPSGRVESALAQTGTATCKPVIPNSDFSDPAEFETNASRVFVDNNSLQAPWWVLPRVSSSVPFGIGVGPTLASADPDVTAVQSCMVNPSALERGWFSLTHQ
jgi:hypothetical protein